MKISKTNRYWFWHAAMKLQLPGLGIIGDVVHCQRELNETGVANGDMTKIIFWADESERFTGFNESMFTGLLRGRY